VPITVAVDAMGGDLAPGEIVAGAVQAAEELGVRVLLVGLEEAITPLVPANQSGVEVVHATEVVAMHDAPAAVRTRKDSSIVVSAELVRDGKADAMTSAGNTGAAMAAALLRMGRIKGAARPAIAVPIPVPGRRPQILVDGGATVDCTAEWLRQFAVMGREYARIYQDLDEPRIGLLSNGEESGKGDDLRKEVYPLLAGIPGFIGNVEGRDFMHDTVDVIVTDGFTGNVALKTVEGAIRGTARLVFDTLMSTPELQQASEIVTPALLEAADQLDPDSEGGCVLLGVDGVCVIAHGSSNARAMRNSVRKAKDCVETKVVERMKGAIADAG
jgi:glycerol-3-phosphate acyltransferase PlsX